MFFHYHQKIFSRVQDNDDLAPLFNQYNDILKQTYGDFFVAELIESQDENNQALETIINRNESDILSSNNDDSKILKEFNKSKVININ